MPMNTLPLRHELKYFINERQYFVLSGILDSVLSRDPNGDEYNEYHIRSLYFDTMFNNALYDKVIYIEGTLNGVYVEVAFQHNDGYSENTLSFVNNIITPEGSLAISAVWACVRILSETVGTLLVNQACNLVCLHSVVG